MRPIKSDYVRGLAKSHGLAWGLLFLICACSWLIFGCQTKPKPPPIPDLPPTTKPGIVWLNGTGASCLTYARSTRFMETQGYKVVCPRTSNTADGLACMAAIEKMTKAGMTRIGIAGHSQGGGAAFVCAQLAEAEYGGHFPVVGVEPAHGYRLTEGNIVGIYPHVKSPSFQWYGTQDRLVTKSWVWRGYQLLGGEKYWLGAVGARHIPVPYNWIDQSVTFFDWKLKGSLGGEKAFKSLTQTSDWKDP